ncbi:MAG: LysR family transcriptional regulator [Comamonas sp.]|uniref:winged helix-turn-helix domain-containing protein n=1 Tax=Comamonas sp. TaxID=34028 RepID=UPI00282EC516|nr:LysR family transcriptional regulator [Comamonas sp.]MDR0213166.1 LysR family transcriptional regulator [Comamonas sp.]
MRVITGNTNAIGPGKIELLEAIDATRSISAAAKSLGMSYRRAWLLVDELNQALCRPAVAATTGGARGGGSELTETGHQVIELYRKIEQQSAQACSEEIQQIVALVRKP